MDTSLIKRVPNADTPFTGVFQQQLGDSIAVNWRNEKQIRLKPSDMSNRQRGAHREVRRTPRRVRVPATRCRATTVALAREQSDEHPIVIVTPGQPYSDDEVSADTLAQMDYLVAHAWELKGLAQRRLRPRT